MYVLAGFILRMPFWDPLDLDEIHDDSDYWVMPEEGLPGEPLLGFGASEVDTGDKYRKRDEVTKV